MRHLEVEGGYLLKCDVGDVVPDVLQAFCKERSIHTATAEGLGALADVRLGFFDVEEKRYQERLLQGSWELLSLVATVSSWKGEPFVHTHVVLSGPDFVARGGHLFEGTVSVTAEIRLWTIERPVERRMHPKLGLHLFDL